MSRLTCAQCEGMLPDAAEDLLPTEERVQFELHLAGCSNCTRLLADVTRGAAWLDMLKAAPPVPPEGMVDRILARTSGDPAVAQDVMQQAVLAQSLLGHGGGKVLPFRMPEPLTPWARMAHTVMQPRFAMTAAMAFFSLALTMNLAGVKLSALRAADLKPSNVKKSFWNANGRAVRYYDNLRVVYELESRVREMQRENDADSAPRRGVMAQPAPEEPQPQRQPSGPPRSATPQRAPKGNAERSGSEPGLLQVKETGREMAANDVRGEGARA